MAIQTLYQQKSKGETNARSALLLGTCWNGEEEDKEKLSLEHNAKLKSCILTHTNKLFFSHCLALSANVKMPHDSGASE